MGTFLFNDIVFGPVSSRRLGVSLGINLLPLHEKNCNFNCVYCECGWTPGVYKEAMPSYSQFVAALKNKLEQMKKNGDNLDVITFAGNGEPTLHKEFAAIVDATIELRNSFYPHANIAVLSNGTRLYSESVVNALRKVETNIQKIDSAFIETVAIINLPATKVDPKEVAQQLRMFEGNVSVQTMFIRGEHRGKQFDNTTDKELEALIELYKIASPKNIMIYCISRDTPSDSLEKVTKDELDEIAEKIRKEGFEVHVSY